MHGYRLWLSIGVLGCWIGAASAVAQQPDISESKKEVQQQIRQDQALKAARQELKSGGYKPAVRKQMELGQAAFSQEQYAIAFDRYWRAYEKESDSARRMEVLFLLGQCQQRMNHAKDAAVHYSLIWRNGGRDVGFLQAYLEVLFMLGDYASAEIVLQQLERQGVSTPATRVREESIRRLIRPIGLQEAFGLGSGEFYYDSAVNTAFSEYAPALVLGQLYFTSSRPGKGQTVSDPRTAQGYSRLCAASFDPLRKAWSNVQAVTGVVNQLDGNVGTFSYDSVRNIGYFTWSQFSQSGIYTVRRQADGSWGNLQQFVFNYREGGDDFLGKVAHPSVSKDGNRLLFVYRDVSRPGGTDIWYVERVAQKPVTETRRNRRVSSPSRQTQSENAGTGRRRKNQSPVGQAVIKDAEWGLPVRLSDSVNTFGREAFPQWVNDTMFVFASDGHIGYGGMDLYLAVLDARDKTKVVRVNTFPAPVNSSYDDNSLLVDPVHGLLMIASNRYTSWGRTDNLFILRSWGARYNVQGKVFEAQDPEAELAVGRDADLIEAPVLKRYSLSVKNRETDFQTVVYPDSSGMYTVPLLEAGSYDFTLRAEGFPETTRTVQLHDAGSVLPMSFSRELNFAVRRPETEKPVPPVRQSVVEPDTVSVLPPSVPVRETLGEDLSPKAIIADIDSRRDFSPALDMRYVDDYQKRVNDPLRRAKLSVVPATAECEVCGQESQWQRNIGEEFFVKSGDDKALITLTDQHGHVSYVDLAPNAAYSIQVQVVAPGSLPKLPTGIQEDDIRKTVVTRDYILFECVPKLAELNDETYVNNVYFDFDKETLVKDAPRELDRMIIIALKNPQMYFQIEANADERGSEEYNQRLTDRRLHAVTSYVEEKGMDMRRVIGKSYGKSSPLIPNAATEQEHRLNRRTTFRLFDPAAVNVKRGDADYPVAEVGVPATDEVRFMVQIGAFRVPLDNPLDYYGDIVRHNPDFEITYYMDADGLYKYNIGNYYTDLEQARSIVKRLLSQNRDCYIAAFYQGRRITVAEASAIQQHVKNENGR